jgi:hypothetical protein
MGGVINSHGRWKYLFFGIVAIAAVLAFAAQMAARDSGSLGGQHIEQVR